MMSLVPVEEARSRILGDIAPIADVETEPLAHAIGRQLATDLKATRSQPPFPASAMDGYAVRAADVATVPVTLKVIGEAPAGHGFSGSVRDGEAVRIFTGAPVPSGADTIVIQENAGRLDEQTGRIDRTNVRLGPPYGGFQRTNEEPRPDRGV